MHDLSSGQPLGLVEVLENLPTAFYWLDHEWRFRYVNAAAEALIGMRSEQAVGGVVWELFPAAAGTVIEDTYRHACATGEPASFEAYYPAPLNAWFQIRAHPVAAGLLVYFLDITTERRAADARRRAAARTELMVDVASMLAETTNLDEAAARLAPLLVPTVGDWCLIDLFDESGASPDPLRNVGYWHVDDAQRDTVSRLASEQRWRRGSTSPLQQSFHTGNVIVLDAEQSVVEMSSLTGSLRALAEQLAPHTVIVHPLVGRRTMIGLLTVATTQERGSLTDDELVTLKEVSRYVGLALDSVRLYSAQRQLAEDLQRSFLTALPVTPGLQVEARYWPAESGIHIGGDWYDVFDTGDGHLALVIGDVTGHDRDAAVTMAQIRNLLRGVAFGSDLAPAGALTRLDDAIMTLSGGALTSMVYATLTKPCPEGGRPLELRWSNAGHPPPMLIRPGGETTLLTQPSELLLGIGDAGPRHEHVTGLGPGDTLVLYTDGLVERRGESLSVGLDRLTAAAAALAGESLDTLCNRLMDAVAAGEDDTAMLAVRVS